MSRVSQCSGAAIALISLGLASAAGAEPSANPAIRALEEELQRSMKELSLPGMPKPYFIAYRLADQRTVSASARFGGLLHESRGRRRYLSVEVRVGDYNLDNSNFVSGFDFWQSMSEGLPLEDDSAVVRHQAWAATDRAYKLALDRLEKKKAARKSQTADPSDIGSFSKETPIVSEGAVGPSEPNGAAFPALARKLSGAFRQFPFVQDDRVDVHAESVWKVLVTSEGTRVSQSRSLASVDVSFAAQADDGMRLHHAVHVRARDAAGLPNEATLLGDVRLAAGELDRARGATALSEDASGPVLFEGTAATMIFGGLLGQDLSGTPPTESDDSSWRRMMSTEPGLRGKLGQRILPRGFRVEDDPTIDVIGKILLLSGYKFDDEGVAAQRLVLVDDGVLKTLLMSRAPIKEIPHSNGHGMIGFDGTEHGALTNLIVTAPGGLGRAELRRKLVAQIKETGASHGYVISAFDSPSFTDIEDFQATSARGPRPLLITEVDATGKERPVRSGNLSSLDIRLLKDIVAAGTERFVRYGHAGGDMPWLGLGSLPGLPARDDSATLVIPALLFKDIEIKKPVGPQPKRPLTKHPFFVDKGR